MITNPSLNTPIPQSKDEITNPHETGYIWEQYSSSDLEPLNNIPYEMTLEEFIRLKEFNPTGLDHNYETG